MNKIVSYIKFWLKASNKNGHGVHSPFVYNLITEVINDKRNFYAVEHLKNYVTNVHQHKKNELLFKIINYYKYKKNIAINVDDFDKKYFEAATNNISFLSIKTEIDIENECLYIIQNNDSEIKLNYKLDNAFIILLQHNSNQNQYKFWQASLASIENILTLNFYDFAIVVCKNDFKVKQHFDLLY